MVRISALGMISCVLSLRHSHTVFLHRRRLLSVSMVLSHPFMAMRTTEDANCTGTLCILKVSALRTLKNVSALLASQTSWQLSPTWPHHTTGPNTLMNTLHSTIKISMWHQVCHLVSSQLYVNQNFQIRKFYLSELSSGTGQNID